MDVEMVDAEKKDEEKKDEEKKDEEKKDEEKKDEEKKDEEKKDEKEGKDGNESIAISITVIGTFNLRKQSNRKSITASNCFLIKNNRQSVS